MWAVLLHDNRGAVLQLNECLCRNSPDLTRSGNQLNQKIKDRKKKNGNSRSFSANRAASSTRQLSCYGSSSRERHTIEHTICLFSAARCGRLALL